ncbi:MAG: FHA domain-containing protein [Ignavibacteriota bacterium]
MAGTGCGSTSPFTQRSGLARTPAFAARPGTGAFAITDQSRNGTWLNGRRLANGSEAALPDRAEIRVAEVITLTFEVRK